MTAIYQTSLEINTYQVDFANRIKLSALFHDMQETASVHASQLGLGYEALSNTGLFWVLSWARIEIDRLPGFGDIITISTWPKTRHRLFSIRDFLFADSYGQIFARASTAWLLLEANSRRVLPLERLPRPVPYQASREALAVLPDKLPAIFCVETLYSREVAYSDLDLLGHVNNARYIDLLCDAYNQKFHNGHQAKSLTISFRSEARYGDHLEIRRDLNLGSEIIHRLDGVNQVSGKTVFQAAIEWST